MLTYYSEELKLFSFEYSFYFSGLINLLFSGLINLLIGQIICLMKEVLLFRGQESNIISH